MQNFYSSLLNANQRYCYQILESAVRAKMPTYNAPSGLTAEQVFAVTKAYTFEHPEICYYPGMQASMAGNSVSLRYLNSDQGAFNRKVEETVGEINKLLKGRRDEYTIVKTIYEYVTLNYSYDHKLFDQYREIVNGGGNLEAFESNQAYGFTVYGFFMNHKAVCFGIAKGFKLLCDRFNISCMLVPCNERLQNDEKGTPHIFNRVRVNGKESFVDCTYGLVTKNFPMLHYELFLASRADVDKFYILENELSGLVVKENFYIKKNVIFSNKYALRMFLASFDAVLNKGCVRFKYIGNDMAINEVQDFALEILNKHAPRGKTYLANFLNGWFNGMLLTHKEADKLSKLSEEEN